jgi:hypothetical protein
VILLLEIFLADKYHTEKCRHRIGWVMCWQRDGCGFFSNQIQKRFVRTHSVMLCVVLWTGGDTSNCRADWSGMHITSKVLSKDGTRTPMSKQMSEGNRIRCGVAA